MAPFYLIITILFQIMAQILKLKKIVSWNAILTLLISVTSCSYIGQVQHGESILSSDSGKRLPLAENNKNNLAQNQSKKQFPDDVGWLDIKQDYGARGDGITDDTKAIKKALAEADAGYNQPTLIYFPEGTYLVSDTLEWPSEGQSCCITFQGQGKDSTVIKLKDHSPEFGNPEQAKAVIRTREGNIAFRHYIRDLTVNTGKGNPNTIAIDYISNNRGAIENVNIKSGDGEGKTGLSMTRQWPGPSLVKNVSISGFDRGIRTFHSVYGITLENITLKNQKFAGIQNTTNTLTIRNLKSFNTVPVIRNIGAGLAIIVNGNFKGGSNRFSAIDNEAKFYGRNIKAQGYQSAVQHRDEIIPSLFHQEYVSEPVQSLFNSPPHSLNLPVEETPVFHDNNLDNWANVQDYPSIQAAMNSGKSTIYFPTGKYPLKGIIAIPATVRKIIGFESRLGMEQDEQVVIKIEENSPNPLIIEGFLINERVKIEHASPRTLALEHSQIQSSIRNAPNSGKLFLEDVQTLLQLEHPQTVWARQLNAETLKEPQTKVINNGGNFWILGLKTEGKGSVITTINGGRTELLGALIYPVKQFETDEWQQAAFINQESSQSLIYSIMAANNNRNYLIQVEEIRDGEKKLFLTKDLLGSSMPLFVGYK